MEVGRGPSVQGKKAGKFDLAGEEASEDKFSTLQGKKAGEESRETDVAREEKAWRVTLRGKRAILQGQ